MKGFMQNMWKNRAHVVMALPAFLVLFFIMYVPMAGLVMAFKAFDYSKGIFASPWNGIENFKFLLASKSTFFNYRREGLFDVVAVPILGKIRYLYAQSKLDKVFRPIDLLAAVQSIENRNKKRS